VLPQCSAVVNRRRDLVVDTLVSCDLLDDCGFLVGKSPQSLRTGFRWAWFIYPLWCIIDMVWGGLGARKELLEWVFSAALSPFLLFSSQSCFYNFRQFGRSEVAGLVQNWILSRIIHLLIYGVPMWYFCMYICQHRAVVKSWRDLVLYTLYLYLYGGVPLCYFF
jgi:hypothetical protein